MAGRQWRGRRGAAATFCVLAALACSDSPKREYWEPGAKAYCMDRPDGIACEESTALTCENGEIVETLDCAKKNKDCAPWVGCVNCEPLRYACIDNGLYRCAADGKEQVLVEQCHGAEQCAPGGCSDLCAAAETNRSYVGCEYFPVFTANSELAQGFEPAVIVGNPNWVEAEIRIRLAEALIVSEVVPPQSSLAIPLSFVGELRGIPITVTEGEAEEPAQSVLAQRAAYQLTSSVPVTVHQFNPLLFELPEDECMNSRSCFSYTNDASLLVPTHVLRSQYIAIARTSFMARLRPDPNDSSHELPDPNYSGYGGFITVTAVEDEPVTVSFTVTAHTQASADGTVPVHLPGDRFDVTLARGDVFQLLSAVPNRCDGEVSVIDSQEEVCDPGDDYDLTGTLIEATGRIAVFSGHDCAYVPFDRPACDHLEEQLFPVESWGRKVVVTRPRAVANEPYLLRVVSAADNNRVRFSSRPDETMVLHRGQSAEIETTEHVIVSGSKAIAVAQYLIGQGSSKREGDPSMGLAIPVDQYRSRYDFLSPPTYNQNYVNVVAPLGAKVLLDGEELTGFERVGRSNLAVAIHRLTRSGSHVLEAEGNAAIGAVLYGYAPYTSYMLPAGLDFKLLTEAPL